MLPFDYRGAGLLCAGLLLMIVFAACVIRLLQAEVAIVLTLWVAMSVPLGIIVGHCALREE